MPTISAAAPSTRSSSTAGPSFTRLWPIPRGSTPMAMAWGSVWSHGSRRTIAWCWSDERAAHLLAAGPFRGDRALCLDGPVLPGAVRFRRQDQPVADRDRPAALHAGVHAVRWIGG